MSFSTGSLPPADRLPAYRDMLDRSVGHFDIKAAAEDFQFDAVSFDLPRLGIAHITSSALRIERPHGTASDDCRDLVFAVMHDGGASREQRGKEVVVTGGGAFLSSNHDPLVTHRTAARQSIFSLRRRDLAPMLADLDKMMSTAVPADAEAVRLLSGYSSLVFQDGATLSAEACRLAVSHVIDLIALAIGATRDAAEIAKTRGLRAARRADLHARAGRLIMLCCDDAELATGSIAPKLGVSARLLQKIFAEHGETVMERLWGERVQRAARLLSSVAAADRTITDIAFACGFNDSSHFGRMFADRMGMTPSQWRKQQGRAADVEKKDT
ncbi:MAG: helix-turn-helix domain-containing protein [Alphaproteobacteria bacterium]